MKNLTFVIGAGASTEAGFPIGSTLKNEIEKMLQIRESNIDNPIDKDISSLIDKFLTKRDISQTISYHNECSYVSSSLVLSDSIDAYISSHRDNEKAIRILKSCILKIIWNYERKSPLYSSATEQITYAALGKSWYLPFFKMLVKDCNYPEFKDRMSTINLIIFNYDRCVEQFLYKAVQAYYRVDEKEARDVVTSLSIYHPYGTAGNIFKNSRESGNEFDVIEFGGGKDLVADMFHRYNQIKTFSESTDEQNSFSQEMLNSFKETKVICFLGFSFGKMNMDLLNLKGNFTDKNMYFYATIKGMPALGLNKARIEGSLGKGSHLRLGQFELHPLRKV